MADDVQAPAPDAGESEIHRLLREIHDIVTTPVAAVAGEAVNAGEDVRLALAALHDRIGQAMGGVASYSGQFDLINQTLARIEAKVDALAAAPQHAPPPVPPVPAS